MKNLLQIKGALILNKQEQRNIQGGRFPVAQNCPGTGGAMCPPYCYCAGTYCVFNSSHPRAGQFCYAY